MNPTLHRPPSLFWPLTLIAVGVLWLLVSANVVPTTNLWALTHLWPLALIAFGAGLLLGIRWEWAARLVTALVITLAVLAVVFAPQLGWTRPVFWNIGGQVGGAVGGSGVYVSETRPVTGFSRLLIEYPADVVIRQGQTQSLVIEADDNLLSQLSSEVRGGQLRLGNTEPDWQDRVNPSRPVQVTLTVAQLRDVDFASAGSVRIEQLSVPALTLHLQGAGDVTLAGLDTERLECDQSGAGTIRADGVADDVTVHISGLGDFQAADLHTQTATLTISGAGNATVWVERDLTLNVSGAGSVDYWGAPAVHEDINGAGSARRLGDK